MVYFGPHVQVDYDHSVFESTDEILVMQQHCGGENRKVFKKSLKAGGLFTRPCLCLTSVRRSSR